MPRFTRYIINYLKVIVCLIDNNSFSNLISPISANYIYALIYQIWYIDIELDRLL